jgi:hypothetical protein
MRFPTRRQQEKEIFAQILEKKKARLSPTTRLANLKTNKNQKATQILF